MGKQALIASSPLLQPAMAALGERPIACQTAVEVRFSDVIQLLACHVRPVEWDVTICLVHNFQICLIEKRVFVIGLTPIHIESREH